MGSRIAAEMLMTDKILTAPEALKCGFINAIISDIPKGDFFDVTKIPSIPILLNTDFKTLVNAKKLLN